MVGHERLVVEAENLSDIVEIGMLCHKCPMCMVLPVIEVSDSNFDSPIILVIELYMPMHTYWAHVMGALQ